LPTLLRKLRKANALKLVKETRGPLHQNRQTQLTSGPKLPKSYITIYGSSIL
jgi:hypothetical protein